MHFLFAEIADTLAQNSHVFTILEHNVRPFRRHLDKYGLLKGQYALPAENVPRQCGKNSSKFRAESPTCGIFTKSVCINIAEFCNAGTTIHNFAMYDIHLWHQCGDHEAAETETYLQKENYEHIR